MTPLPCRADSVRDHRETHSYLLSPFDGDQGLGRTGRDAWSILAEITRYLVRKNDRCSVQRVKDDRIVWTGLGTVAAPCATLQKQCLGNGTGRTQPIRPHRWWSRLLRHDRLLLDKFLCGLGNGYDRILEKVAASI